MADDKEALAKEIRDRGYDVGVVDTPGSANVIPPPHRGSEGGVQPGRSDLSKNTKITLGAYLGKATERNYIPVDPKSKDDVSLTTPAGNPAALDQDPNSGNHFADVTNSTTSLAFVTPDAGPSGNNRSLKDALSKGRQDKQSEYDGNTLLPQGVDAVRERYTSAVLKSNRFTSKSTYVQDTKTVQDVPRDLAYYSRQPINDVEVRSTPGTATVTHDQMRKVGQILMLRSTGELDSNSRNYDPEANVGALLPGSSQILPTQIINSKDLEARDVLESMIDEEIGSKSPGPDTKSWGSLNNHLEPFTGILPAGMIALCVALILALRLSFELLGTLMSVVTDKPKYSYNGLGIYFKGKYRSEQIDGDEKEKGTFGGISVGGIKDLNTLLGLRHTSFKYDECFKKGMDIFFGTDGQTTQGGALGKLVTSVGNQINASFKLALQSPGFYVIFCRSIIRSGYGIGKKLSELGSNPLSVAQGVINIVEELRSSKIIAAYNMFAQMGDNALRQEKNKNTTLNPDGLDDEVPVVFKNRYNNSRALAWRSSAAHSLYILPQKFINSAATAGAAAGVKNVSPLWDPHANFVDKGDDKFKRTSNVYISQELENRIPSELVKKFEQRLDAEYVPFYLQDLRTNEIISFHAFLQDLSDDFTANWENHEAYGRVDAVRIYKNTGRSLKLSFRIVALDPADFDSMWFKINKLVTMVYPQWSRGKRLTTPDNIEFTQPFSQLISASPIVRIRIGDLIRSNYSKFSLVRMFDVTDPSSSGAKITLKEKVRKIADCLNAMYLGKATRDQLNDIQNAVNSRSIKMRVALNAAVIKNPPTNRLGPSANAASSAVGQVNSSTNQSSNVWLSRDYQIDNIETFSDNMIVATLKDPPEPGAKYGIPIGTSVVCSWANENWTSLVDGAQSDADLQKSRDFLGETNPIVKYFEDSAFKGLACTIDSLSFNWLEQNMWEVSEPGSQAPKSCTVSLSLTPIHDIAPGLDASGFNRAPVYRVGQQVESISSTKAEEIKRADLKSGGSNAGNTVSTSTPPTPSVLGGNR